MFHRARVRMFWLQRFVSTTRFVSHVTFSYIRAFKFLYPKQKVLTFDEPLKLKCTLVAADTDANMANFIIATLFTRRKGLARWRFWLHWSTETRKKANFELINNELCPGYISKWWTCLRKWLSRNTKQFSWKQETLTRSNEIVNKHSISYFILALLLHISRATPHTNDSLVITSICSLH